VRKSSPVFGQRLKTARRKAKITMRELADHIQAHRTTIARWEKAGSEIPSALQAAEIARVLGVSVRWLLGMEDDPSRPVKLSEPAGRLLALFDQLDEPGRAVALEMLAEALELRRMGQKA
jgi:transcriptional regulator with XRE-family HTH domain